MKNKLDLSYYQDCFKLLLIFQENSKEKDKKGKRFCIVE